MKAEALSRGAGRLSEAHADQTRQLILDSALEVLIETSLDEMTVRAVSRKARISERTIFRYFATRDDFLNGVAAEIVRQQHQPPHPRTMEELLAYPRALFDGFEARSELTRAALHTEMFQRIGGTQAHERWVAIQGIVDERAPRASAQERKVAAANIRYFLSASAWRYFRDIFGFGQEDAIACAETAIRNTLAALPADPAS